VVGCRRAKAALEADWPRVLALDVSSPLARSAGDLAEHHRLRGFAALHLASYLAVAREFAGEDVRFSSADGPWSGPLDAGGDAARPLARGGAQRPPGRPSG